MKGVVFTEFMTMVEDQFGIDMVDDLIDSTDPASGGAYTAVGTYNAEELVNMVVELSRRVEIPVPTLIKAFGNFLGEVFATKFNAFFQESEDTLSFLKRVDNHIHVEVAKLYPDAELPVFSYDDSDPNNFVLHYESSRNFADLAEGLIEATAKYYNQDFNISRTDEQKGDTYIAHFTLTAK